MTDIASGTDSQQGGGEPSAPEEEATATSDRMLRDRLRTGRWVSGRRGPVLLGLLAVVPPLMMLREVLRYPQMHFFDYWWVLLDITAPDGSLEPFGLLNFRNEHPFVLPSLLFWLSARFGDGLNQLLGVVIVAFGVACVLLVWRLLPAHLGGWARAGLVVAASTLVFNPHGIHNYVRSMSGASWILAMMLVLAALLAMHRQHRFTALALGLLASISYGTAFALWPALTLVAWLRGERRRWAVTPMATGLVVVAAWFVLRGPQGGGGSSPTGDPAQYVLTGLSMLGMLWTGDGVTTALLAGVGGLAVVALHARTALTPAARAASAPWWGLVVYALGCAVMVSASRAAYGTEAGLQSRYNSMAAALWITVLVLVVAWPLRPNLRAVALGCTVLTTLALGAPMAESVRDDAPNQRLLAVAVRVGAADAMTSRFPQPEKLIPRLRSLGHFPFSDEFTLGCPGDVEIGSRVDTSTWRVPETGSYRDTLANGRPVLLNVESDEVHGQSRMLGGWAIAGIERARCVAVLDSTGRVVGGGVVDIPRVEAERRTVGTEIGLGYRAVAPADAGRLRLAFRFPSGWWIRPLSTNPEVVSS